MDQPNRDIVQKPEIPKVDGTSGSANRVASTGKPKPKSSHQASAVVVSSANQFESSGGCNNKSSAQAPKQQLRNTAATADDAKTSKYRAKQAYKQRRRQRAANERQNLRNIIVSIRNLNTNLAMIMREAMISDENLSLALSQTTTSEQLVSTPGTNVQTTNDLLTEIRGMHLETNLTSADMGGFKLKISRPDVVSLPVDISPGKPAPLVAAAAPPTIPSAPAKPSQPVGPLPAAIPPNQPVPPIIWRKSPWWRRLIFKELPSRLELDRSDNLHIGTLAKYKRCPDGLTTGQDQVIPELQSYLLMSKFSHYSSRKETLDHLEKLARKYWKDEKKTDFGKLSPLMVNRHFITLQKVVDEQTTPYLLAEEVQSISRKQRFRNLAFWKRETHTTSPNWAPFHQIPQ